MRLLLRAFVSLALTVSASALIAKPVADPPPAVQMSVSASSIQWSFPGPYDHLALTVGGPDGFRLTKEFEIGRLATIRLNDLGEKPEGTYTWELRVIPRISDETRRQLAAARKGDDDAAIARIQAEAHLDQEILHSGGFMVLGGAFVTGSHEALPPASAKVAATGLKPAPTDVVTNQSEEIQGSLCVGLDCVVNESFGFDTIRLKENNTRITFFDTSTSFGFPNNIWTLTANDSASGGLNKFSIDDVTNSKTPFTVIANAPTNSLFIASTGKVGFGNSAPVLNLHITATDTPAIRQEQTSGGGFTAQTWDIGANEANWFVRDVTGGSRLPLRIRPGAPTSSIDISASGNVGIGTASPQSILHVKANIGAAEQRLESTTDTIQGFYQANALIGRLWYAGGNAAGARYFGFQNISGEYLRFDSAAAPMYFVTNGVSRFAITPAGDVGIGNLTPASKLHVNGDVRVTGGSFIDDGVTLIAPDYVFDSTYKLMPIDKLADFVRTKKHLPGVPDANMIKSQGLNMSQFQMQLLEKVEQLTLYTISLKAENDQLQKRLDSLEKTIALRAPQRSGSDPN